ncbi:MAG: alpha/beta hydrolase [Arhodomonas sp.]|nr:alpha/beta hydrolase [Arhodomonas sp.]
MPQFAEYFARLQRLSDATRAELPDHQEDVAYGGGALQTLDCFPAGNADAPLHVFFHGGYWRSQDKRDYAFVARALVPRGVSVVVANYDLCPAVTIAEINEECAAAIRFLEDNRERLGLGRGALTVSGHSAGGQIVARLLTRDWSGTHPIHAALTISGVFDLTPLPRTSINDALGLDEATARSLSPLHGPPPPPGIPLRLAVGGAETAAFHRQSEAYRRHAGVDTPVAAPPGRNHFDVLEALFLADGEAFDTLLTVTGA